VHLFLVLSGFCLFWPFVKGGWRPGPTLWQFARRRCRRILPPYYVVLALCAGAALLQAALSAAPDYGAGYVWGWLWRHAVMAHNLSPGYVAALNPPLWTLALEFQLYVLFPVLVEAFRRFGGRLTLLAVFAFTVGFRYLIGRAAAPDDPVAESVLINSVFGRCFEFALGMWAAERVARWHGGGPLLRPADGGIVALFALAAAADHRFWHLGVTSDAKWGLLYAALLLAASRPGPWAHRLLSARWLVACGIFSYSVYLIHEPLMIALRRYAVARPLPNAADAALELGVVVPLMLALGYGFHLLFERPFMAPPAGGAGAAGGAKALAAKAFALRGAPRRDA
jgi:peptidoglycan/LPS O-acetylase OafA/YrhL